VADGFSFDRNVFVNCPFDTEYSPILDAMLFCLIRFGLNPRIATERGDSGEARIDKILDLVQSSRYSIHDLSRCQARTAGEHYRLNMPFELGIDFGCRRFGPEPQSRKVFLVLEEKSYSQFSLSKCKYARTSRIPKRLSRQQCRGGLQA